MEPAANHTVVRFLSHPFTVFSFLLCAKHMQQERNMLTVKFKICKSVRHHTIQINQPTRCNNFSSLLLDVYVQLNMFWASSRPSSGAQQLK